MNDEFSFERKPRTDASGPAARPAEDDFLGELFLDDETEQETPGIQAAPAEIAEAAEPAEPEMPVTPAAGEFTVERLAAAAPVRAGAREEPDEFHLRQPRQAAANLRPSAADSRSSFAGTRAAAADSRAATTERRSAERSSRTQLDDLTLDPVSPDHQSRRNAPAEEPPAPAKRHSLRWLVWVLVLLLIGGAVYFCMFTVPGQQLASQAGQTVSSVTGDLFSSLKAKKTKSVTFLQDAYTVRTGDTLRVSCQILPVDADNKQVEILSSNEAGLEGVEEDTFLARTPGEYILTAYQDGQAFSTCRVTVTETPVESIVFSADEYHISLGGSQTIDVRAYPSDATDPGIQLMTGDESVIRIDGMQVYGVAEGTATLRAVASNGISADATVTVAPVAAEALAIAGESTLELGTSETLTPLFTPSNATDQTVSWTSSNPAVASADANGNVTALAVGKTDITAHHASGLTAVFSLEVTPVQIQNIRVAVKTAEPAEEEAASADMKVWGTLQLVASLEPELATGNVSWASSDTNIATVSSGTVTARSGGSCTITATAENGVTGSFEIHVVVPLTGISFKNGSLTADIGYASTPELVLQPSNTTETEVVLESSDPAILRVEGTEIIGVAEGTVKLTATAGEKTCSAYVTVVPPRANEIQITGPEFVLVGNSAQLVATVLPEDAADKTVTWKSDRPNILTVDENGTITGVYAGQANVTATLASGLKASVAIDVVAPAG